MKSIAFRCHAFVLSVHLVTASEMRVLKIVAFFHLGRADSLSGRVVGIAISKTLFCEAIQMLLVLLVLVLERNLNALDEHATDSTQCLLDVAIELPTGLLNGLLGQTLYQSFHVRHISIPHGGEQGICGARPNLDRKKTWAVILGTSATG
jgi:hypothetical protein